jgi:hypothetical protein
MLNNIIYIYSHYNIYSSTYKSQNNDSTKIFSQTPQKYALYGIIFGSYRYYVLWFLTQEEEADAEPSNVNFLDREKILHIKTF